MHHSTMFKPEFNVTCPEMLLKISGVIDIQGFYVMNKFIPRQLAVITRDTIVKLIDFKTNVNYNELCTYDRKTVKHVQKYIHFLDFEPSCLLPNTYSADECAKVLRQVAIDFDISADRPLAVNNPQAELLLTIADIPYVAIRNLISDLPNTDTIIAQYSRGTSTFSASSKVASLWRLILSKQFELKNKSAYEQVAFGCAPTTLASLISEENESTRLQLAQINRTLNNLVEDMVRLRLDLDDVEIH